MQVILLFLVHRAVLLPDNLLLQRLDALVLVSEDAGGSLGLGALLVQFLLHRFFLFDVTGAHVGNQVDDGVLVADGHLNLADDGLLVGSVELAQLAQFPSGQAKRPRFSKGVFTQQTQVIQFLFNGSACTADSKTKALPGVEADIFTIDQHRLPGKLLVGLGVSDLLQLHQGRGFQGVFDTQHGLQSAKQLVGLQPVLHHLFGSGDHGGIGLVLGIGLRGAGGQVGGLLGDFFSHIGLLLQCGFCEVKDETLRQTENAGNALGGKTCRAGSTEPAKRHSCFRRDEAQ